MSRFAKIGGIKSALGYGWPRFVVSPLIRCFRTERESSQILQAAVNRGSCFIFQVVGTFGDAGRLPDLNGPGQDFFPTCAQSHSLSSHFVSVTLKLNSSSINKHIQMSEERGDWRVLIIGANIRMQEESVDR